MKRIGKVLTTGQVARVCGVAPRTVCIWIDSGRLSGYRLPGCQDRRIPRDNLIRFMKEHHMPMDVLEDGMYHKVLFVGPDNLFLDCIRQLLPENEGFRSEIVASSFEAGILFENFHPDTIIVDLAMGRTEGLQIANSLLCNPRYEDMLVMALASEDEAKPDMLCSYGFKEVFKKPFDIALLARRVRTLVERNGAF